MRKVPLGTTREMISCIGLGTMYFGTRTDKLTSFALLDYYANAGGTFLDTANKYASWVPGCIGGESETLIGRWLKQKTGRDRFFISTKVGFPYGDIPCSLRKDIVVSECEKSLKRLGIDTIDLYFAHVYDKDTPPEEVMDAFHLLKKQGKIRYAGASNYMSWQLFEANRVAYSSGWEGFCCIQQRHSYLEPSLRADFGTQLLLTPEISAYCQQLGVTMMAYSPLLGGTYTRPEKGVPLAYQSSVNDLKLKNLNKIAKELYVSPNTLVLAWMVNRSTPVIPLVAASNTVQLHENLKALQINVSQDQMDLLNQVTADGKKYS